MLEEWSSDYGYCFAFSHKHRYRTSVQSILALSRDEIEDSIRDRKTPRKTQSLTLCVMVWKGKDKA